MKNNNFHPDPDLSQPSGHDGGRILARNTIDSYNAVIHAIQGKLGFRNSPPPMDQYTQMAEYVFSAKDLAWRTRNLYRAALLWRVEIIHLKSPTMDTEMAIDILRSVRNIRHEPGERKKSSRVKTIPQADLEMLMDYLRSKENATPGNAMLLLWISSGLMTGARPNEWLDAKLMRIDEYESLHPGLTLATIETSTPSHVIQLRNSKVKQDAPRLLDEAARAEYQSKTPPFRYIPLSFDQYAIVSSFLGMIQEEYLAHNAHSSDEHATIFGRIYERSRKMLDRAVRNVFGSKSKKNYTLYTLRGQFSANIRAILGKENSYFLMGHASKDVKASSFYGTAVSAHKKYRGKKEAQSAQEFIQQRSISIESAMRAKTGDRGGQPASPKTPTPKG